MMSGNRGAWDETDDGRLWTLLAEGLSAREIGERMGRSKNAILSRVHRRGWKLPIAPIGGPLRIIKSGKYAASPKSPPSPPVALPVVRIAPEPLPPAAAPSLPGDVQPAVFSPVSTCQFPTSDGRPWRFCGEPVVFGGPYCAHCRAICWQTPPRWQRDAA